MSKQLSFQIEKYNQPLKANTYDLPVPNPDEVRVKVAYCGVCHSDVHFQEGEFDLGEGVKLDMKSSMPLPMTPGHEIVGTVDLVGNLVKGLKVGDQVALFPLSGCNDCSNCSSGLSQLCHFQNFYGSNQQGGFSTHVVAKESQAVRFQKIDLPFAATCCCSGITTFSAIKKLGRVSDDDKILFIGAGGLGLMALQLFKAMFPTHPGPTFADIDPKRLEIAMEMGASETLNLKTDSNQILLNSKTSWIGQGFQGILDFVGSAQSLTLSAPMLNKGGKVVVVGLFGGSAKVPVPLFPLKGISILGNYLGTLEEFKELINLLENNKITPPPLFIRPLSEASQALSDLRNGKVIGRTVLKVDAGSNL